MRLSNPLLFNTLLILLTAIVPALSFSFHPSRALLCNNSPSHCTTRYSSLPPQIGSHDSPFIGPFPSQNQNIATSAQLDRGVRMLQAQTHRALDDPNAIQLCHTDCLLEDAGRLQDWLGEIKTWLEREGNGNEVVTLLLTNGDAISMQAFGEAFKKSEIEKHCFVPGEKEAVVGDLESWPTLGDMIARGKRVVVFMDSGAESQKASPYILPEFPYFFETPFGVTDPAFPSCSIDRPPNTPSADGRMYIINHFLDVEVAPGVKIPDRLRAGRTNSGADVAAQVERCKGVHRGRRASFVLLDFVDVGDWDRDVKGKGGSEGGFLEKAREAACGLLGGIGLAC
ncbi:hypothetical protein GJ744_007249 [Endocarpon pusillum]|uniref:PLC-like phosphodiesterase n=1 Tax=Endocarpon pusillum TaxID=364733 RepID=A0A8H7E674_9EURO|nr:hypothetical protein GJ744_007249 [Endocarpon pusillum]